MALFIIWLFVTEQKSRKQQKSTRVQAIIRLNSGRFLLSSSHHTYKCENLIIIVSGLQYGNKMKR